MYATLLEIDPATVNSKQKGHDCPSSLATMFNKNKRPRDGLSVAGPLFS